MHIQSTQVSFVKIVGRYDFVKDVILKTKRVEMKFPVPFMTPQIIVEAIGDKETIEFMDAVPTMEYTEEDALSFIEFLKYTENSDEELELGIFDNETNKFIGMCTLENINREYSVCELGYWLNKEYVGKGYMTECVKAIIKYEPKNNTGNNTQQRIVAVTTRFFIICHQSFQIDDHVFDNLISLHITFL